MASTFTIWVANAQAELVAGTTITTVDPETAASVGSDLGVTQFTADDPPCRATSRRRQAVFRAATGGDGQSFRSWIQILKANNSERNALIVRPTSQYALSVHTIDPTVLHGVSVSMHARARKPH